MLEIDYNNYKKEIGSEKFGTDDYCWGWGIYPRFC